MADLAYRGVYTMNQVQARKLRIAPGDRYQVIWEITHHRMSNPHDAEY